MDPSLPPNERAWRVFRNVVDHMHRRCESISMHAEECLSPPHNDTIDFAHYTLEVLNHLELGVWEWKERDLYAARKDEAEANWSSVVQALPIGHVLCLCMPNCYRALTELLQSRLPSAQFRHIVTQHVFIEALA